MSGNARRSMPRRAFTLVDVMITVLIIGILATVAVPRFGDSVQHFQLQSAAKSIVADLQYARQYAKTKGKNQAVVFTPAAETYQLSGLDDVNHTGQPYLVDLAKTPYPADLVSASFGASGTTVTFDLRGDADNGGTVVIAVGSEQQTIVVNGLTGKASLQ